MKVFSITEHSIVCAGSGFRSTEHFLFQYKYDFFLVIYCCCMNNFDHVQTKLEMIQSLAEYNNHNPDIISKSNILKETIRENKIDALLNRDRITEICYLYKSPKEAYCFSNDVETKNWLVSLTSYEDNYFKAKEYLKTTSLFDADVALDLINQMTKIYIANGNDLEELNEVQKIKLTKLLTKNIVKLSA